MTTTTIPDQITARGTIESATYKPSENPSYEDSWALKAALPGFGKYAQTLFVPASWGTAQSLAQGTSHRFLLAQDKLKADKSGEYHSDFFWKALRMDTFATPNAPPFKDEAKPVPHEDVIGYPADSPPYWPDSNPNPSPSDWAGPFRSETDEARNRRIARSQALNAAIEIVGPLTDAEGHIRARWRLEKEGQYFDTLKAWASKLYPFILDPTRTEPQSGSSVTITGHATDVTDAFEEAQEKEVDTTPPDDRKIAQAGAQAAKRAIEQAAQQEDYETELAGMTDYEEEKSSASKPSPTPPPFPNVAAMLAAAKAQFGLSSVAVASILKKEKSWTIARASEIPNTAEVWKMIQDNATEVHF